LQELTNKPGFLPFNEASVHSLVCFLTKINNIYLLKSDQDPYLDRSALVWLSGSGSALGSGFESALKLVRIHNTAMSTGTYRTAVCGSRWCETQGIRIHNICKGSRKKWTAQNDKRPLKRQMLHQYVQQKRRAAIIRPNTSIRVN
jgi:hypothetical protein